MADIMVSEKIAWATRLGFAQLVIALLFVFSLVNVAIPHAGDIRPLFLLMAVYYWAVFRPTLIPPVMAFVWGILFDILAGLPIGMNALLLVMVQWIVRDQRLYLMGQSYVTLWLGFAVTVLVYSLLQWGIFALMTFSLPDYRPALATGLLSIGLFPVISLLLVFAHRLLPQIMGGGLR
jgi:rod shape-determining protein MreD